MSLEHPRKWFVPAAAVAVAALLLAGAAALTGFRPSRGTAGTLRVVTSSTLLGSAVAEIAGDRVSVETLIAPGSCPGHYDLSPRDTRAISSSDLVLTHGYEAFVDRIVDSMGAGGPGVVKIRVDDNWLIPDVYVRGARLVAKALRAADPSGSGSYRASLALLETRVEQVSRRVKQKLAAANVSDAAVFCSDQQAPLVRWMGFEVVRTYSRAEEFTPAELRRLNAIARKERIALVIDNLQSGPIAGRQLAADIGAAHVTLSSFPGGFPGTDTWSECLEDNVDRVLKGLSE